MAQLVNEFQLVYSHHLVRMLNEFQAVYSHPLGTARLVNKFQES